MTRTTAVHRFADTLRAGVQNLLDVGCLLTADPLGPRMSRPLEEIRAEHAIRLARLQAEHEALRERNRARTVNYYLQRSIDRVAEQYPEHAAAVEREARRRAQADAEPPSSSNTTITSVNGQTVTVQFMPNLWGA